MNQYDLTNMICKNCNHDLAECTCEDLEKRFTELLTFPFVHIGEDYKRRIRAHIDRRKAEQSKSE